MRVARGKMLALRMIVGVLTISLVLINLLYGRRTDPWIANPLLFVIWIGIAIFQIYYVSRTRSRLRSNVHSPHALQKHLKFKLKSLTINRTHH